MSVRLRWTAAATLPALLIASIVVAQETAPQVRQDRRELRRENRREALGNAADRARTTAVATRGGHNLDSTLVDMLAPGNQEEIALGRLAEQKSQNPMVKEFAQQMVQDHTKFVEQLRRFGNISAGPAAPAEGAATEPAAPARAGAAANNQGVDVQAGGVEVRTPGTAATTRTGETAAAGATAGSIDSQILPIMHEVHQRCLASSQRYLQQKQGQQFDDAYVGMQIVQHMQMLDKLAVATEHASPELQQVLQQGTETAQNHFQHAEQLMQQIARGGAQGAQREGASSQNNAATQNANQ